MKQLTLLDLSSRHYSWSHSRLKDISPLSVLSQLTSLNLNNSYSISDLSPLSSLVHLTTLNLSNTNYSFKNINLLSSLIYLTTLDLSDNQNITDISPLEYIVPN